ncbi:MAG: serine hydrolase [Acidimicrobiales bacterium]
MPLRFPAAFVVVDADTGAVITGLDDRTPRRPASTTKILTALVVRSRLERDAPVTISARAAATPARKLTLEVGETWRAGDLLRAMLICSCNDAAVALAEAAGGDLEGFARLAQERAGALGLRDHPTLVDPSGLDGESSVKGGNLISARDLAIATRAFLADGLLASIAVAPNHRFVGGDGEIHEVVNHNQLLGLYPGAIGVKTGFTRQSGSSLVAAARRNGRTIIVVLLDSPDVYLQARQLLDIGFATLTEELDRLPLLTAAEEQARTTTTTTTTPPTRERSSAPTTAEPPAAVPVSREPSAQRVTSSASGAWWPLVMGAVVALTALVGLRRRQVVRHRRRRDAARPLP